MCPFVIENRTDDAQTLNGDARVVMSSAVVRENRRLGLWALDVGSTTKESWEGGVEIEKGLETERVKGKRRRNIPALVLVVHSLTPFRAYSEGYCFTFMSADGDLFHEC